MAMHISNATWVRLQDSTLPRRGRARDLVAALRSLPVTTMEGGDLSPTNNTPDDHGTSEDFAKSLIPTLAEKHPRSKADESWPQALMHARQVLAAFNLGADPPDALAPHWPTIHSALDLLALEQQSCGAALAAVRANASGIVPELGGRS